MIRTKYNGFYFIVYKTTNLINGKIYIGYHKTKNLNDGYIGGGIEIYHAIKKYGKKNFIRQSIEYCLSFEHMIDREIYWIAALDACNCSIGYNIHKGGKGGDNWTNYPNKENWRRKNSESHKGLVGWNRGLTKETDERIRNISEALKGGSSGMLGKVAWNKGLSKETNVIMRNISESLLGYKVTEETKRKIRQTLSNKPVKTCIWCGYKSNIAGNMIQFHFDNCKYKQKVA